VVNTGELDLEQSVDKVVRYLEDRDVVRKA